MPLADFSLENGEKVISSDEMISILYKIASGINFLHQSGIVHLDIKSGNVVCQGDIMARGINPMIIDFGLSAYMEDVKKGRDLERVACTLDHRPPENLSGSTYYSSATDVWSFGMMCYIIFWGYPFTQNYGEEYFIKWVNINLNPYRLSNMINLRKFRTGRESSEITKLLRKTLEFNPKRRATMEEVLQLTIFEGLRPIEKGKIIDVPQLEKHIPDDISSAMALIARWYLTYYPSYSIETLFLAVDLLFRAIDILNSDPTNLIPYIAACMIIANKLMFGMTDTSEISSKIGTSADELVDMEIKVVGALDGIFYRKYLYHKLKSRIDVVGTMQYLFADPKEYLIIDVEEWPLDPSTEPKDGSIDSY